MTAQAQDRPFVETIVKFSELKWGDVFSLRPDIGIWHIVAGKPHVYDPKRDRWALKTRDHGLAFAYGDTKVMIRT